MGYRLRLQKGVDIEECRSVEVVHREVLLYIYMKSSFPNRVKCRSKYRCCNANAKVKYHVLEKSSAYVGAINYNCKHMVCVYIDIILKGSVKVHQLNLLLYFPVKGNQCHTE